jgi:PPOX class probable F420-dependent enzyme
MLAAVALLDADDPHAAEVDRRLREELVIWLTTVSPEGQPQSTPVWFLWDGESFLIFSQPGRPKLRNITENPRVGLHLRGDRSGDEVLIVEGRARRDPDSPRADRVPVYVEKYQDSIEALEWTPASFAADYSEPVRIVPERVRAW